VTEQRFDLVVRNGTIVTPGHREQADVGITGGRIAQLRETITGAGEIDAGDADLTLWDPGEQRVINGAGRTGLTSH